MAKRASYKFSASEFAKSFDGWTIIKTVMATDMLRAGQYFRVEGGLTFVLKKGRKLKTVILGYTELGEWIENESEGDLT